MSFLNPSEGALTIASLCGAARIGNRVRKACLTFHNASRDLLDALDLVLCTAEDTRTNLHHHRRKVRP